jgi:hypothetical protein
MTPNKALRMDKASLFCLSPSQKSRQLVFAAELGRSISLVNTTR